MTSQDRSGIRVSIRSYTTFWGMIGAATKTVVGVIRTGNTGVSNVSPSKRMPIPEDLADTLASASKHSDDS